MSRLLLQFLDAYSVALFRLQDDANVRRIGRRAAVTCGSDEVGPDLAIEKAELPALSDLPAWHACVHQDAVITSTEPDGRIVTLFPIRGERAVMGVLAVHTKSALAPRDTDLVHGILKILQNHLALLDYGERDTLTGLLNRKTFEALFHKLHLRLSQAEKNAANSRPAPSWLALIDIDKFKAINDGFGHLFGDEVILMTSQLMKRNFRGADEIFRFGGEEFVVILDPTSEAGAHIAVERLRTAVEAHSYPQVGKVTISIGYTQIRMGDVSSTCIERADAALYHVKNNGRNGVANYETLAASGALVAKSDESEIELF